MGQNLYEVLAMAARYGFAALMLLIVLRALRITIVDSRRAKTLRRISPQTGLCGELVVLEGDERARRGMHYPVTLEGTLGSARRADVRIRHSSVRRRHAYFLMTPEGLRLRAHAGAPMRDKHGRSARELVLQDGDHLFVGKIELMLVLSESPESVSKEKSAGRDHDSDHDRENADDESLFDTDRMFREHPVLRYRPLPVNESAGRRNGRPNRRGTGKTRRSSSADDAQFFEPDDPKGR